MYVSGVHAQLKFKPDTGWCVADKHSSNGTKLNNHQLQPDVEMSIKNGDILTIANINLQVTIS
jgi:pSer/pThr/pTyr-binding forkhead associated (FHA) protein